MHIKSDINILDFLMKIKKCQGDVYFETVDGDFLVLSSALSQYIFCSILNQPELIQRGVIRFANTTDAEILSEYLCD